MALKKWLRIVFFSSVALFLGAGGGFIVWVISDLPEIKMLETYSPLESSFVYSSDGKLLAELYVERRQYIPHYQIPDRLKKAFIAIEDQRFYSHPGIDVMGILRALYKDIKAGGIVEGGSTITQQLTKMLFLRPEKNFTRKLREAIISAQIEKHYTKDEILGMYMNQAYFGSRAYGIEAAAQTYFGKPVRELALSESALLAALQKAPNTYSPFKNPEKAMVRRDLVLRKMLDMGYITGAEFGDAIADPLPQKPYYRKYEAPYFIEYLRQQLEAAYGEGIYGSGWKIYSTIDSSMQKIAEEAIRNGIATIQKRVKPPVQGSLIAIELKTGHIKAMVGGTDFWETQFNRATMALRQPGSAFKPFVYVAALDHGMSTSDMIIDSPITLSGGRGQPPWSPHNYSNEYHGVVTLKTALALSLNTATVRLAQKVGIHEVAAIAKRCGIRSRLDPYLSLALGSSDVTPLELTVAYTVFATGRKVEVITYDRIDTKNNIYYKEVLPRSQEVLSQEVVEQMREMLRAVVENGTAQKAKEISRMVYGKTGTTNSFSDAWFIGFDDRFVVGVWVGRDDHKPIGAREAGSRAALPIWIEFMKKIPDKGD